MEKKGLFKRVFSVIIALILTVSLVSVAVPTSAEAATDGWVQAPSDHTPSTGVELPKNVSAIHKIAYAQTTDQRTGSTATIADGMALVGENMYTGQIQYTANAVAGTVYVTSFYVWAVGDDAVFDMHFDANGSPSGTGGNYAYNVLKEWSTTHSAYITSCTVDGVATTDSLKGATGGWKKVEIEWTPKATGDVLIMVGDYGGSSNVTGTIYVDDFVTYAKPASYEITVSNFWGAASNTQLVCAYTGSLSTATFTGSILYNGVETEVNFVPSGQNCFIKTADTNTQILVADTTSVAVTAGTKMYDAKGNYLTITNNCSYVKNASGNLVVAPTTTTLTTDIAWNTTGVLSYTFVNEDIKQYDGKQFTGGEMYMDGVLTPVKVIPSGNNLVVRLQNGTSNLTRDDYTKLVIFEGTEFSYTSGNETIVIRVANTLSHKKSGGTWQMAAYDHTPSTGVELPKNVSAIHKIAYAQTTDQRTGSTATIADGMALVGENMYTGQIQYTANAVAGTVYVTSFYVWTVGDDTVFDMHFDAQGSPSGTGADYAYNVLKEWSTTHSAYITSCTVDGVATTDSLKGATGGWKKVEIEWTPKATNNVLIMVGDYGGSSNVTGTIYVDDFVTYAKPASYEITVSNFWGAASNTQLVCAYTGSLSTATFTGSILYNGVETEVNFVPSGQNCFIKTADTNTQILVADTTSVAVTAGTKMYDAKGNYLTITNNCSYVKNASGNLVIDKKEVSADISLYKITEAYVAYNYTPDLLSLFSNGSTFTGNILVNDTTQSVTWTLSDACLIPAGVKDDESTTSIEVKPGTVLTGAYGTITIVNGLKYVKENTTTKVSTPIGWYKVNDAGQILFNGIDTAVLSAYVGDTYTGSILLNGTAQNVTWRVDSALLVVTDNIATYGDINTIQVVNGTILTNNDGSGDTIVLTNDLSYVKINGTWYADTNRAEVTLSYTFEKVNTTTNQILYKIDAATDLDDNGTANSARGWKTVTVQIGGVDTPVQMFFADNYCTFGNQGAASDAIVEAVKSGTTITIPTTFTLVTNTHIITLNFKNVQNIQKLGQGWAMYTSIYQYPNGNIRYYNIDNGSVYTLTSSNNAIVVEGDASLTTGSTISKVGTYNISRIENETLYQEKIVLYKHGDVDESNDIDVRDLVAMKWAQTGTSEKQNGRLSGTYAADIDRSGNVDNIDLLAMRQALASDDADETLSVSKGNSVLNGEMPIAGFSTPTDEAYITADLYEQIAEAGINTITYCGNSYYSELTEKHLSLAEQFGLNMYVTDSLLTSQIADTFATRVGNYSMYQSFLGLHIVDEPTYGNVYVNSYGRPIADYKTAISLCNSSANISGYMNLFPYYSDTDGATTTNYKEYLNNTFTNTGAEMLSYDHYAIRANEKSWWDWSSGDFKKTVRAADFYKNLEMVRAQVEGTGKPFWAFAQAGYPIATDGTVDANIRVTAAEQQWEINAALAMGAKGVQYYQLFQSSSYAGSNKDYARAGLFGANGQKNETYYNAAKELNSFIAVIDEVLMNANNEGVIVNDSTAAGALNIEQSSYNEVTSVTGSNAMVGCFDYYGKTALYVVNCNTSSSQNITLNFNKSCDTYVTSMSDTEVNRSSATTGTSVTINVGAGQSALLIIE